MPLMRDIMQLRLEAFGLQLVGMAASGEEALAIVAELEPALLVVDRNMAGVDGIEVIRRMVAAGSATRTLLYTADPRRDVIDLARAAGANGCLNKSAGHRTLAQTVQEVLAGAAFVAPDDERVNLPMPLRLAIKPVDLAKAAHLADRL